MTQTSWSQFNVCVDEPVRADEMIVFNTLSGAAVSLPRSLSLEALSCSDLLRLAQLSIVNLDMDEKALFEHWVRRNRYGHSSVSLVVFTTRRCNLACTYCYQKDEPSAVQVSDMSSEVTLKMLDWIAAYLRARRPSIVHLTFYGGEPLANRDCLRTVAGAMSELCALYGATLNTYLVTNGTLVDEELVEDLMRYGLRQAQITIDGPQSIHDRRRVTLDGSGSFERTVKGLITLARYIPVVVRTNVEQETVEGVEELLHLLSSLGLARRSIVLSIADTCRWTPEVSALRGSMSPPEFAEVLLSISRMARAMGFGVRNPFKISTCFGTREGSIVVDVDGSLYTCSQMAGYSRCRIGTVNDPLFSPSYYSLLLSDARREDCLNCQYLPLCMGGCRAEAVQSGLGFNGNICRRDYYSIIIPGMVQLFYGSSDE